MKTYRIKLTRTYETDVKIDADSESDAMKEFEDMLDAGLICYMEMKQMNVTNEDIEITEGREVSHE